MKPTRFNFMHLILGLVIAVQIGPVLPAHSAPPRGETPSISPYTRPAVEVVFVLDTTGSMGDLIAAAKEKIWSIADTLATADPAPDIKMGLVGYRDRGDVYVTTQTPLSDDLDAVYSRLMQFQADGGGDTPESVNQALYEAVTRTAWSRNPSTYRVIFLVGDAPPQMGYADDVTYQQTCALAAKKNIIINAIQCGDFAATTPVWQEIARLAEGRYFSVGQSGSAVLYETPYDRKIAELSRDLDNTRIYYGSAEHLDRMAERKARADRIYEAAAPSALAKRTIFNSQKAGTKNFVGNQELINDLESGAVDLDSIKKDELPTALKNLNPAELKAHVTLQGKQRRKLQSQIEDLAAKRQSYIEEKIKAEKDKGASSLDAQIYACIQVQAGKKGITYQGGPAY